ncbi:helix-turn-helix transcriptional regulator [Nocardiopsis sp. CC223A]|uniref:helix-turn-helix domain-containing protein n=1 Tax=Nocardiopsis sp. CC223A TaxID=3044051 RepID=UPI00278C1AD4|nr:helix-turn-helix transcriptional regulator [Nocardiopsis sp. CC223A]
MARPETKIDPENGPIGLFASKLRDLRKQSGSPTYRDLAKKTNYSVATLSEAARGCRRPTLDVTLAYIDACGGDREEWIRHWRELDRTLKSDSGTLQATRPASISRPSPSVSPQLESRPSRNVAAPSLTAAPPAPTPPGRDTGHGHDSAFANTSNWTFFLLGAILALATSITFFN